MPIAKSELNDTNSMNVSTQVTNPLKAKNDTVNATDKDTPLKNVVNEIREGTEINETSKNESMPIAKSKLNDTNSMNVSTQVTNLLKAKNDTVNAARFRYEVPASGCTVRHRDVFENFRDIYEYPLTNSALADYLSNVIT